MTKNELTELLAKSVGAAGEDKELVFQIFSKKISDRLNREEAITIPKIGTFQLKQELTEAMENSWIGGPADHSLLFVPQEKQTAGKHESLFLSFPITKKELGAAAHDEDFFSIGVGKPLAVSEITDSDSDRLSLNNIEKEIDTLLDSSGKVSNFNIWSAKSEEVIEAASVDEVEEFEEVSSQETDVIDESMPEETAVKEPKEKIDEPAEPMKGFLPANDIDSGDMTFPDFDSIEKGISPWDIVPEETGEPIDMMDEEAENFILPAVTTEAEDESFNEDKTIEAQEAKKEEFEDKFMEESAIGDEAGIEMEEVVSGVEETTGEDLTGSIEEREIDDSIPSFEETEMDKAKTGEEENIFEEKIRETNFEEEEIESLDDLEVNKDDNFFAAFEADELAAEVDDEIATAEDTDSSSEEDEPVKAAELDTDLDKMIDDEPDQFFIKETFDDETAAPSEEGEEKSEFEEVPAEEEEGIESLDELGSPDDFETEEDFVIEKEIAFEDDLETTRVSLEEPEEGSIEVPEEELEDFAAGHFDDIDDERDKNEEIAEEINEENMIVEPEELEEPIAVKEHNDLPQVDDNDLEKKMDKKGYSKFDSAADGGKPALGRGFWIGVIAFIIVVIAGAYYYFYIFDSPETQQTETPVATPPESELTASTNDEAAKTEEPPPSQDNQGLLEKKDILKITGTNQADLYRDGTNEKEVSNTVFEKDGYYSVQVSSWKTREIAEREANKLIKQGHDAFIVQAYVEKLNAIYFRVRVGSFTSLEEAKRFAKE